MPTASHLVNRFIMAKLTPPQTKLLKLIHKYPKGLTVVRDNKPASKLLELGLVEDIEPPDPKLPHKAYRLVLTPNGKIEVAK